VREQRPGPSGPGFVVTFLPLSSRAEPSVVENSRMAVTDIIHAGLGRASSAGETRLRTRHLNEAEVAELLDASVEFLSTKITGPSTLREGWSTTSGVPGLRRWLAEQAGLRDDDGGDRLRRLRTEIYDLLEERDRIIKGVGHNVPIHLAPHDPGASGGEIITITPRGAGYGDPVSNAQVELAAVTVVERECRRGGWSVDDVSSQNLGWDLTATRGRTVQHLEVKGVSGAKPTILLTRNEHNTAAKDPSWLLVVVTQALTAPTVSRYDAAEVLRCSAPQLYRVALPQTHA